MPDLYTRLFERTAFPLLDRLNGTTIHKKLDWLLEQDTADPHAARQAQETRVAEVVDRTRKASNFYRHLWSDTSRQAPRSLYGPLDRLPVVRKADLAAAEDAFPLPTYTGKLVTAPTSGSTGAPMRFVRSVEQDSWFWALRFRIWRWGGYHPGDPYLTINLNPRTAWKKRLQDKLFRCAYLTFNADNQDSARIVEALKRRGIEHLNGFSSSLYVLARYILDHDFKGTLPVRSVTATGDCLYAPYRETIEEAFGVRVLDYYGAGGEGIHLASQCPQSGDRLHIFPENAILEIVDGEGPAEPGQLGRILVTQLHNDAMPLVRYELEDLAVAAPADAVCGCGRTLPLLERIEGRIPDLVVLPDGTFLVMHFFVVLFKGLQGVHRYQVVQEEADRLEIRLVSKNGCDRNAVEKQVREGIGDATRGLLDLDFRWLDDIPLTGAGKRRLVISKLSRDAVTGAVAARHSAP